MAGIVVIAMQPGQPAVRVVPATSGRGWSRSRPGRGRASRAGSRPAAPPSVPMWSITLNASELMNGSVPAEQVRARG